jgi:hypothetical protein
MIDLPASCRAGFRGSERPQDGSVSQEQGAPPDGPVWPVGASPVADAAAPAEDEPEAVAPEVAALAEVGPAVAEPEAAVTAEV